MDPVLSRAASAEAPLSARDGLNPDIASTRGTNATPMPAQGLLYCTQRDLELIKLECQANEVPVEESMLLWTPAEARRFFTECIRPEPDLLAKRKVHDKAPKRPWIATNETEMLICICCCCGLYGFTAYL